MRKILIRELKPFSLAWLENTLKCSAARAKELVGTLMVRGIVRYRTGRKSDPEESDMEDANPSERYQFRFVGLILINDVVIVAYPKYFRDREPTDDELKLIFRALKRNMGIAAINSLEDDGTSTDNKLPVMLALLELYGEYGEYSNYTEGYELNGNGNIDWNRTISKHLPVLSNNRPVYMEYETRRTLRDDSDYITRLHRAVLTECSFEFHEIGINELLSLDEVCLSDNQTEIFGDAEELKWRLERERATQFTDWKLLTLDLLERYLFTHKSEIRNNEMQTLGTTSFYHLWEEACKIVLGDVLETQLGSLEFSIADKWAHAKQKTLLAIIPKPRWERWHDDEFIECGNGDTLIPDTVAFANGPNGEKVFCIYDAKYYVPSLSGNMKHQPGLESVTKQFLYQSAYRAFVTEHGFNRVVNAFLVPSEDDKLTKLARVSFTEVMGKEEKPFSNYIDMWALPANKVLRAYLDGRKIDGDMIQAIWEGSTDQRDNGITHHRSHESGPDLSIPNND